MNMKWMLHRMSPVRATAGILSVLTCLVALGCGSEDPSRDNNNGGSSGDGDGDGDGDDAGNGEAGAGSTDSGVTDNDAGVLPSYLPWAEGNTWTYRVTQAGVETSKVTTVGALEAVGGTGPNSDVQAHRVETDKEGDLTVSWQALVGDSVLRYREQAYSASTGDLALDEHWDPYKVHFDGTAAHTQEGATWLEVYEETKLPVGGVPETATARDRWTVLAVDEEVTVPAGTFSAIVLQKVGGATTKTYHYVRGVGKVKEEGTQTEELVSFEVAP
jgi:hypothetical protein